MQWKSGKDFAFTIIDDTDGSTVGNTKPIYDYLAGRNIRTTKTVWVYPSRDKFTGQTIQDREYLDFLMEIGRKGFEIQIHSVGSGSFNREEIIRGLEIFRETFGHYPSMQINHGSNPDSLYYGYKRFGAILKFFMKMVAGGSRRFHGDEPDSEFFWGDLALKHIRFIRNRVFNGINTLRQDPRMPFKVKNKTYSNYWFSSSDGHTVEEFNNLVTVKNIDKLKKQRGLCIIYTHFSYGFIDEQGEINKTFIKNMDYLTSQNGWFVPASEILEYLAGQSKYVHAGQVYLGILDLRWLFDRVIKKIRSGR
jgi:hypothetical protein